MDNRRYFGLDALRGGMMMLGIVLHAAMLYLASPPPTMPIQTDRNNSVVFDLVFDFIHSFRMPTFFVIALVIGFFLVRQYWIAATPKGALGGGITHVPSLLALIAIGVVLLVKRFLVGRYLLIASAAYVSALLVRSWDLYICPSFPVGVHWLWHLLTALTATVLVYGVAKMPPLKSLQVQAP